MITDRLVSIDEAMDHLELPKDEAMTFACEVELRPEFELPALTGIKLEREPVDIGDEMVQQEIDRVRATRGQYVPVTKGKVHRQGRPMSPAEVKTGHVRAPHEGRPADDSSAPPTPPCARAPRSTP